MRIRTAVLTALFALSFTPTVSAATVAGTPGNDHLRGGADRDFITGDTGDDDIDGAGGSNIIDGGLGNDRLSGGQFADSINGGPGDDNLYGNDGNDGLTGASGNDHIYGGAGNDRIEGGLGQDLIDGGSGGDNIVSIDGAPDIVRCGSGHDTVRADGGDRVSSDCETVIERPGSFGKTPDVTQHPSSDTGSLGHGGLVAMTQFPSPDECGGVPAPNPPAGSKGSMARANGDRLDGGGGNDTLGSGQGGDCLFGANGSDVLSGGAGNDFLDGGEGVNLLSGGEGNDVLRAGSSRDFAEGGPGADDIDTGRGSNVVNGAIGNDRITGGQFADSLNGGSDEDTINGGAGDDGITGASGNDHLYGEAGNDRIEGGLGADFIDGGDGGDNISAADGMTDEIRCGPGHDTVRADGGDKVDDDCETVIMRVGDQYLPVPVSQRRPAVGIADQNPASFAEPAFRKLGVRRSRLVMPWNQVLVNPASVDNWLNQARAAGILDPLVAFNYAGGKRCLEGKYCPHPSAAQFDHAFRAFHERYPWVTDISPWNEANHISQPTAHHPEWAATYYNIVRKRCPTCTIVAADVLDQKNMVPWLEGFLAHADGQPSLIGLHNYSDVNRHRSTYTRLLINTLQAQAKKNRVSSNFKIWLTETGGIVRFETVSGRVAWPTSTSRAASALNYMFALTSKYRRWVRAVYVYQWKRTHVDDKFDAGIVDWRGHPRAGYGVLARHSLYVR